MAQLLVEILGLGFELLALLRYGDTRAILDLLQLALQGRGGFSQPPLELVSFGFEFVVAQSLVLRLELVDFIDIGTDALDLAVIFGADNLFDKIPHLRNILPDLVETEEPFGC